MFNQKLKRELADSQIAASMLVKENAFLKRRLKDLEKEIEFLKPVVKSPNYRPPISDSCYRCKYVLKDSFSTDVIACCKDAVCADFMPREEIK